MELPLPHILFPMITVPWFETVHWTPLSKEKKKEIVLYIYIYIYISINRFLVYENVPITMSKGIIFIY